MNIENERKLFIEVFSEMYLDPCEWDEERNCFKDFIVHLGWQMWQASANREGFVLVPIESNSEIENALDFGFHSDYEGGYYDAKMGYENLIKVLQENKYD